MSIRRFFLVSLVLAVVAVGLHFAALGQISRSLQITTRAITLSPTELDAAKITARSHRDRGSVIYYIGLAFALGSLTFLILSARKHEPAWRSVPFSLLVFYLMMQFVLV